MVELLCFFLAVLASPFKSRSRLEAENGALRHQLIVLRRKVPGRVRLMNSDRWFFVQLYRLFPSILQILTIIRPETLVRWHRAGFRGYWRWKSRSRGGRPQIEPYLRALIRRMSIENPLWGAPRIHGELLKLGFEIAQSSVAKCMVKRRGPPSQGWRTFLRNHAPDIAAMDLFIVPTISFGLLYALVIVRLDRRELVWVNVTAKPTAEWIAGQITEAFPWDDAPQYLIRDRDRIYGIIRYDLGDSVLSRPDRCPCGSLLRAIRVAGRRDDVLRFETADGRIVTVLPLAIGAIVDETPGVHRSQLVQTDPITMRLRLDPETGVDVEKTWGCAIANLKAYLVGQGLANVEVVRASEPTEQSARSGKFRQVITRSRGAQRS